MSSDEHETIERKESSVARASREARGFWQWLRERFITWKYILPLITILGVLLFFGFKGIYVVSFLLGAAVWYYWGSKMDIDDCVMVLCANLDEKTIGLVRVGRRLWRRYDKEGEPMQWASESGHSLHIVREHDQDEEKVVYPVDKYSDLEMIIEPKRYAQLIAERQKLLEENTAYKQDMDALSLKQARKWSGKFNKKVLSILEGPNEV